MFVCYLWETEIQNSEFGFYWKTEHFLQKSGLVFSLFFSGSQVRGRPNTVFVFFVFFFFALQLISSLFKNGKLLERRYDK